MLDLNSKTGNSQAPRGRSSTKSPLFNKSRLFVAIIAHTSHYSVYFPELRTIRKGWTTEQKPKIKFSGGTLRLTY